MKKLILIAVIVLSNQAFSESVVCRAEKAIQESDPNGLKVNAEINFDLNRETKELTNMIGHIFAKQNFMENEDVSVENSYMGFFNSNKFSSNPNYKPVRYIGFTQYKNFNAIYTTGLESGMWGNFVIDLTKKTDTFRARYIFQAGDHMGGTVLFTCRTR